MANTGGKNGIMEGTDGMKKKKDKLHFRQKEGKMGQKSQGTEDKTAADVRGWFCLISSIILLLSTAENKCTSIIYKY